MVGDSVRFTGDTGDYEAGWGNLWHPRMTKAVGHIGTIRAVHEFDLGLSVYCKEVGEAFSYPYFVLEPVKEASVAVAVTLEEATKHDSGKPHYSLIPPEALDGLARLYTMGAQKYDARNWEKGMAYSRLYDAMQRHAQKWFSREDHDQEDGQHHLLSAIWCAMALYTYQARPGIGTDDRPEGVNLAAADILWRTTMRAMSSEGARQ